MKNSSADVAVLALVGERNREVRDFIEHELGPEGMRRSVLVVATSDRPSPLRVRACYTALAVAEYFRDQGKDVLLVADSVTRLAMAQREIGLATGEPPSQKGYTPSVFQMMPRIFERAGRFRRGSITAFFTVLVEGDDMNEPIADAVRGILDGHIVLSRQLGHRGHYPAIDVLQSVSRLATRVGAEGQSHAAAKIRDALAALQNSEDLIRIGAYAAGSNPKLDAAIRLEGAISAFLRQRPEERSPMEETLPPDSGTGGEHGMKRFAFRLERLLQWRRKEFEQEQERLRSLQTEWQSLADACRQVADDQALALQQASRLAVLTAEEIRLLEQWRLYAVREIRRLETCMAEIQVRIEDQKARLLEAHRRMRRLEKLRESQLEEWKTAGAKAEQASVEELVVSRWGTHGR